ncbi:MAG: 16S rRNA (cytidine(1402)-2'-O)-methyltransferase [Gammaproteobacteria bacterium]|nr:16S rRNA (cytidine(1402)-2'-O)-methyltransferase [Gammaproteobacteria bacterium]MDE1887815.1 16S rRNA (cytidine(1402)-2'-O)-methyltransferase [Gammaproteobacteria bacterium]MDE2022717.1 16S rRNA (cytidine(1402)-2'-O)-methyltransferase [Gammaproteobacteria bacterium]MDE2069998.1 16S rRNA (cytidine(1402)-2'-O)-methyltransferase [Gammaproteobacteria bacterium]MDE2272730.1 16S rRNA (cytidine(1402)-2'-O)-methyltransferase [Gammaproteobacteria bacterium]
MTKHGAGVLYVVATPIGNLEDLSPRAQRVMAAVQLIAAEDTRHTRALLAHFGLRTPLLALHDHNEAECTPRVLARLLAGESVALVSDAGTPLISDPGFNLVRAARTTGVTVSPIPGPSALIAALSVSGLPTERFVFEGFLPTRSAARRARLTELAAEARTLVFYEAVHRVQESLADMAQTLGAERAAVIARELTKVHETVSSGTLSELATRLAADAAAPKGEAVVLVAGAVQAQSRGADIEAQRVLRILLAELPVKQAAELAARIGGGRKNRLYATALEIAGRK